MALWDLLKLTPITTFNKESPRANQGIFKAEPRDNHAVCTLQVHPGPTHLPLSHPFCWSRTYLQGTLQEVTSQDEVFMPDISSYPREKGTHAQSNYSVFHCHTCHFILCQPVSHLPPEGFKCPTAV